MPPIILKRQHEDVNNFNDGMYIVLSEKSYLQELMNTRVV